MASYAVAATTGTVSATLGANHLYFLQTADNPGMVLVTQLLTDQNYNQWKRSVMIALSEKNKLGLVDGTHPKPVVNSPYLNAWIRCNDMVISLLLNSVSLEIRNTFVYRPTAKLIWDDLVARFSLMNVPRLFYLKKEIVSRVRGTLFITSYFTKFRTLIDELDNLSSIPRCVCVLLVLLKILRKLTLVNKA